MDKKKIGKIVGGALSGAALAGVLGYLARKGIPKAAEKIKEFTDNRKYEKQAQSALDLLDRQAADPAAEKRERREMWDAVNKIEGKSGGSTTKMSKSLKEILLPPESAGRRHSRMIGVIPPDQVFALKAQRDKLDKLMKDNPDTPFFESKPEPKPAPPARKRRWPPID